MIESISFVESFAQLLFRKPVDCTKQPGKRAVEIPVRMMKFFETKQVVGDFLRDDFVVLKKYACRSTVMKKIVLV